MKNKTFILLGLNLVAFFFIATVYKCGSEDNDAEELDGAKLAESFQNINEIVISKNNADPQSVLLIRTDDEWQLEKPLQWPADRHAVQKIVRDLEHIEANRLFSSDELTDGETLQDYGLASPSLSIRVMGRNGPMELGFGATTRDQQEVYVLAKQQQVIYAVDKGLYDALNQPLQNLMQRNFFDLDFYEIKSLSAEFNQGGTPSTMKISRISPSNEDWTFETPIEVAADGASVRTLINDLLRGTVTHFVMPPQEMEAIAEKVAASDFSITLQGNLRSETLVASEPIEEGEFTGMRYANLKGSPTLFVTSNDLFKQLKDAQRKLRNKRFMRIEEKTSEIDSIDLADESRRISLKRDEQKEWKVSLDNSESVDGDTKVIEALLTTLAEIEAEKFVDAPSANDLRSYGLPLEEELEDYLKKPTRLTISLGMQSGEKRVQRVLLLGNSPSENEIYVKCRKEPVVYVISNKLRDQVPLTALHYRTRLVEPLASGATIKTVTLLDLENNATLTGMEDNATQEATTKLSELIRQFEIQEYLPEAYSEKQLVLQNETVSWRFKLTVEIVLPGGDSGVTENRTYFFSQKQGTSQYGGSPNFNLVFTLEQRMIDAIQELLPKGVPPLETNP